MHQTLDEFIHESEKIVSVFNSFAQKNNLAGKVVADHICYKCGSSESFERLRALFEKESEFIYQSIISERRIAIIKFKEGIETNLGLVMFLELSDQKPDGSQNEGFDHIEVYPVSSTYEELVSLLEQTETVIKVERPHHTTHDIRLEGGFIFRCEHEPLLEKIKREEMK